MPRILKAPSGDPSTLTPFAFDDLGESARDHLELSRREAAEILANAHAEATEIRQQAEAAGRAEAQQSIEKTIAQRVAAQAETLLPALQQAIAGINAARTECLARWEASALDVAMRIAERVIRREVAQDPKITLSLVRESLELAAGSTQIQLRMHPDDLSLLQEQVKQLATEICRLSPDAILPDATISRGGCHVETRGGSIDQQIETQLTRIAEELR